MALQPLPPIPNTRLVDDPARDAIWRRYLEQLFNRIIPLVNVHNDLTGLQGGTTNEYYHLTQAQHSTVTSFGTFTNNRVLVTGPTSSITTSDDIQYSIATSTLTALNVSTLGTLTVGNASSDAFIINAGTWTYNSNFLATRAAGTLPTGTTNFIATVINFSGDSGGGSNAIGYPATIQNTGANNVATIRSFSQFTQHSGTGAVTNAQAMRGAVLVDSTGNITNATIFSGILQLTSTGSVTNGIQFQASAPTLSSTGAITNHIGFQSGNLGNATLVTNALGFDAADMTAAATLTVGYRSQINSGTGKWGFLHTGTANNAFAGSVRIGSNVAPTVALDVTGTVAISGGISLNTASKVSAYTYTGSDYAIYANASGAAFTLTVPHASTLPNKIFVAKKTDSTGNAVTVSSVSNIDGATTTTLAAQFNKIMFQSNGTQWWEI